MTTRPNILLLLSDQQRADSLPCYGNTFVEAPYLDAMAAAGAVFDDCRTVFPVCTPARASMWTGVYPHTHDIIRNVYGPKDMLGERGFTAQSMFGLLKDGGYQCAYFGKWHLGSDNPGPFDVWQTFNSLGGHWVDGKQNFQGGTYIPDRDTDNLIDWFRTRERTGPFAAAVSYYPPHDPYSSPLDAMDRYRRKKVPFPGYYGSVTALDRCVGRVIAALEESGELENTVIIYYSDHGETFHHRDGTTSKFVCTEDSVHVPFLIRGPGVPAGLRSDAFIGLQDLMPTVLDFAGIAPPAHLHGRSIRPLLNGEADWRQSYYIETESHELLLDSDGPIQPRYHERALCTREYKLVVSASGPRISLYNRETDPEERIDLLADRSMPPANNLAGTTKQLLAMLREHAVALDDPAGLALIDACRDTAPALVD